MAEYQGRHQKPEDERLLKYAVVWTDTYGYMCPNCHIFYCLSRQDHPVYCPNGCFYREDLTDRDKAPSRVGLKDGEVWAWMWDRPKPPPRPTPPGPIDHTFDAPQYGPEDTGHWQKVHTGAIKEEEDVD